MKDEDKTKVELIKELEILRKELEKGVFKNFIKHKLLVEQDLRESEERYKNLIENINESIITVDLQGNLLTLNSRAVSYLGGLAEDYIGKTLWDIFPKKVAEERFAGLQKVIQSGDPIITESYIPFQGKMLCFLYNMQPIRNRVGDIYAVLILASDITEQKQAEEKLKDSEEYLKILFDYAPDAYYINDLKGNFIDGNRAAERLIGCKREELIGKSFLKLKLLSAKDMPKATKSLAKSILGLPTGPEEYVLNRKDKSTVEVEISNYPVKIKGKTYILGIARDITERKKAEKALIESEEKYRTIFENTGTATIIIEEDKIISMVNAQSEKMYGYSKEEIENKMKWTDFVIPEDLERMEKYHIARRKAGGKAPTEYEFRLIDKKGNIRDIFLKIGIIPNTKKSIASLMDTTERKKAEQNIKSAKDELQMIMDSVPAIIFYKDIEGRIIRANKALADLLKMPVKDIVGKTTEELFPKEEAENMRKDDQKVIISGKPKRNLIELYDTPEGKRWAITDRIPYKDKEGKITGLIGLSKDITIQKKIEEKLKQTYKRLKKSMDATLDTMSRIIEAKDPYTSGHQHRVCQLAVSLARELDLSPDKIEGIRIASLIHDIGKIGLPTEILSKPGKLSDIEFSLIKEHAQVGYDILKSIDFSYPIANIVLQHHENIDGSGYPNGVKDNEISIEAKILRIADVVEAMSSFRPYRPAKGIDAALEEITQNRGILYDPEVVGVCLKLFKEKSFKFES